MVILVEDIVQGMMNRIQKKVHRKGIQHRSKMLSLPNHCFIIADQGIIKNTGIHSKFKQKFYLLFFKVTLLLKIEELN